MKTFSLTLSILFALLFIGCSKDEFEKTLDIPPNLSLLVNIKFDNYLLEGAKGYVIATDSLGNILAKAEVVNNSDLAETFGRLYWNGNQSLSDYYKRSILSYQCLSEY